jgi:hypothetical protein
VCLECGRQCSRRARNFVLLELLKRWASKSPESFITVYCTKLRLVSENMNIHQHWCNNLKTRKTLLFSEYMKVKFKVIRMQMFWMPIAVGTNTYNCYLSILLPYKVLTQILLQPYLTLFFLSHWQTMKNQLRTKEAKTETWHSTRFFPSSCCFVCVCGGIGLEPDFESLPCLRVFAITIIGHTTISRAPLDEWLARGRELCLTTNNIHKR